MGWRFATRKTAFVGAVIALGGLTVWWASRGNPGAQPPLDARGASGAAVSAPSAWWNASLGSAPAAASPSDASTWTQRLQALLEEGSLQGASLDGGWGVWDGKTLAPSMALRRRFDQLLSTHGETDLGELRAMVQTLAEKDLGAAGAAAVLAIWDRYVALIGNPPAAPDGVTSPQALKAAHARLQQQRRERLGAAWADAFFREDERLFEQTVSAMTDPASAPALSEAERLIRPNADMSPAELHQRRVAEFGSEAAERMREESAYQARWAQRLGDARAALAKINTAPELSPALRVVEVQRYLDTHFEGGEQVRVRALLGI